jgi:hypothetical protein
MVSQVVLQIRKGRKLGFTQLADNLFVCHVNSFAKSQEVSDSCRSARIQMRCAKVVAEAVRRTKRHVAASGTLPLRTMRLHLVFEPVVS